MGNLSSIFAMASDGLSSSRKTAKGILLVQCLSQVFYGLGSLVLGGYSGAVQNVISLLRNFAAMKKWNRRAVEWTLILAGVVVGLLVNNLGIIGLLAVVANLEYSLVVFRYKDNERALKWAFLVNLALFAVFNAYLHNYIGALGNIAVFLMTAIFLYDSRKREAISDERQVS